MAHDWLPAGWTVERPDAHEDLTAIVEIERASFANPWTREMFEQELLHPDVSHTFVIRTPPVRVAGYCVLWMVLDEVHINNLAVRPDDRQRGIGRALLRAALAEAATLGGRRATLEVRESNTAALRLYGGFGFRVTGVRPGYYSNPVENALVLWLDSLSGWALDDSSRP